MLAPRPQGCSVLSLAALLMGGSVLGCRQVRLIRLIVASIVPCYWLQSLRLPATIIYHPRVISSHYSAQYCLQSNYFLLQLIQILKISTFKTFKMIFSCEEAALEGQMSVCLIVCVSDPKTEFHLSSFNCQPLTYLYQLSNQFLIFIYCVHLYTLPTEPVWAP